MGWVDRHNRFRQAMLMLDKAWKTKRYQTRVQLEVLALSMVGTYLACRMFTPRWRDVDDSESVFNNFMRLIIPQLDRRAEEELLNARAETVVDQAEREQEPMGRRIIRTGVNQGKTRNIQERCTYCRCQGKKEKDKDGSVTSRHVRTSYRCSKHPKEYSCSKNNPSKNCWKMYLQAHEDYCD